MDIFMQAAIDEALDGLREGGIPIGAVLVENGKIIGRGRNRRVQEQDQLMHAEIDCLRQSRLTGGYHNTTLYSTLMMWGREVTEVKYERGTKKDDRLGPIHSDLLLPVDEKPQDIVVRGPQADFRKQRNITVLVERQGAILIIHGDDAAAGID